MKKAFLLIMITLFTALLFSCTTDYTEELTESLATLKAQIPEMINADYEIPIIEGVDVSFKVGDQVYQDLYPYESPFYDIDQQITIILSKGGSKIEEDINIKLISEDSGYNQNRIDLTIDVPLSTVNTIDYVATSVLVKTTKNGVEVIEHETTEAKLRGRGNSTQMFPKKPYRLRFDQKTSILGMPASKNYVLLAEYSDKSLMRNVLVHKMSTLMDGIDYSLQTRYVELYVNNQYQGVYVLTEQVEIKEEKLFVESIPGIYNTGFLIELDQRFYEQNEIDGFDWILVRGIPYTIKSPDSDDPNFTTAHHDYIYEYLIEVENRMINQTNYHNLIDIDNWVDYFVIQELVKNVDVGWSSVFMHKAPGEKLMFGPLWDFDLSIGNADYIDYGVENWYGMRSYKNRFFELMMSIPDIRDQFRLRIEYLSEEVLPQILSASLALQASLEDMAARNFEKWQILDTYVWPNPYEVVLAGTFAGQIDVIYRYLQNRTLWMLAEVQTYEYSVGNFE